MNHLQARLGVGRAAAALLAGEGERALHLLQERPAAPAPVLRVPPPQPVRHRARVLWAVPLPRLAATSRLTRRLMNPYSVYTAMQGGCMGSQGCACPHLGACLHALDEGGVQEARQGLPSAVSISALHRLGHRLLRRSSLW